MSQKRFLITWPLSYLLYSSLVITCATCVNNSNAGHLKCLINTRSTPNFKNSCGSSRVIEFLETHEKDIVVNVTETPIALPSVPTNSIKIYVIEKSDDAMEPDAYPENSNFTWSLVCREDYLQIQSFYLQTEGRRLPTVVMSGSLNDFQRTFNLTAQVITLLDLCEYLKYIKCNFLVQPLDNPKGNIYKWTGFAHSAFDFVLNSFVYAGAVRLILR